jgi:group I intron endonuclease
MLVPCGIYMIVNSVSGKQYVGSALDMQKRSYKHFSYLRRGRHPNKRLQDAFTKHGEVAFEWHVLEECSRDALLEREQHWIDTLKPNYNIRTTADSNLGLVWAPDVNEKRAISLRKALASEEARAIKRQTITEAWADPEQREKRIAALKKAWSSPEKRAAWSEQMKLVDTKAAEAGKIRWAQPGERERHSERMRNQHAMRGPKHTAEELRQVVEANEGWHLVSITGARLKDRLVVRCDIHDAEIERTVRDVLYHKTGCNQCGWARAAAKNTGTRRKPA